MGKLHYFTALLFIILLAFVSTWLFESIKQNPKAIKEIVRHDPDYFLENFKATSMDEKGKLSYNVTGVYMEHYPDNNSVLIKFPIFSFFEDDVKSWDAQADEALLFQQEQKIYLTGNVIFNQFPSKEDKSLPGKLTTQQLTVEAKKKIAYSKTKINFSQGTNHIKAIGMHADMNKNKIEFLSQTRSHYVFPEK